MSGSPPPPDAAVPLRLTDDLCLRPRLTGCPGAAPRRVLGLLRRAGERDEPLLVDAVDFDGERCRYRTVGRGPADPSWLDERPGDDYLPCARIVVDRLRALGRDLPASVASATASAIDAVVTPEGRVRIAVRGAGRPSTRWIEA